MTTGSGLGFRSVARTHAGQVRDLNEDRFLQRSDVGLWAVADGMGGHAAGEVASGMVVEALAAVDCFTSGYAYLSAVEGALHQVNAALADGAGRGGRVSGSTVVALLIHEAHYACVWAGDSRAYRLRGDILTRITHDHSVVQELVDAGTLTAGQARIDHRANVITRAVGVRQPLELALKDGPVQAGDLFLLCSDGLTGEVGDDEIADCLQAPGLDAAADNLLELSLRRGSRDNVTLVIVGIDAD